MFDRKDQRTSELVDARSVRELEGSVHFGTRPDEFTTSDTADAASDVLCGATGGRTPDLLNAIQALSQLSYSPSKKDHTRFYLVIMVAVPNMENIIICRPYVTVNLLLLKILNISVQSPADVSSF